MDYNSLMENVGMAIDAVGVAAIVLGGAIAGAVFVERLAAGRSRPRVAVKTKRCSLRGEEANSHQRRTAPWRKEYPLAPGLNRPSPAWWKMVSGIRTALPS